MLSRVFGKPKASPYLAMAEYWVYLPTPAAPKQEDIMARMIQNSPYAKGSRPIGAKEGLIWSDVRFHIALALREKNVHIFRPDLFEEHVAPSAGQLESLARAQALLKLKYVSEQVLPDKRHLQFIIYAAEAAAELGASEVAFDLVGERLFEPAWLQERLREDSDATRRELHVQTIWRTSANGGTAETRGLQKIGLPELCTPETTSDHQVVALQVLEAAAERLWDLASLPAQLEVEHYGDLFHVLFEPARKGPCRARILRESR